MTYYLLSYLTLHIIVTLKCGSLKITENWHHLKAYIVSYSPSIATIAISLAISKRNQRMAWP